MINLTQNNFNDEIKSGIVLVDFWAPWCKPCKKIGAILEKLESEINNVKLTKFNIEDNILVANDYRVMNIPTVIFFKNGIEYTRITGLTTKDKILEKIADGLLC